MLNTFSFHSLKASFVLHYYSLWSFWVLVRAAFPLGIKHIKGFPDFSVSLEMVLSIELSHSFPLMNHKLFNPSPCVRHFGCLQILFLVFCFVLGLFASLLRKSVNRQFFLLFAITHSGYVHSALYLSQIKHHEQPRTLQRCLLINDTTYKHVHD